MKSPELEAQEAQYSVKSFLFALNRVDYISINMPPHSPLLELNGFPMPSPGFHLTMFAVITYRWAMCYVDPNPQRKIAKTNDGFRGRASYFMWHISDSISFGFQLLLLSIDAFRPDLRPAICPNHPSRSTQMTLLHALAYASLFIGASLRLQAYQDLGVNFTYFLCKPKFLQTRGIYAYIRHPSYTGFGVAILGLIFWSISEASVTSCHSRNGLLKAAFVGWSVYRLVHLLWFMSKGRRIQIEEEFLVQTFGEEYVQYMEKVPRYFPKLLGKRVI